MTYSPCYCAALTSIVNYEVKTSQVIKSSSSSPTLSLSLSVRPKSVHSDISIQSMCLAANFQRMSTMSCTIAIPTLTHTPTQTPTPSPTTISIPIPIPFSMSWNGRAAHNALPSGNLICINNMFFSHSTRSSGLETITPESMTSGGILPVPDTPAHIG
jgi:hypothetical protein